MEQHADRILISGLNWLGDSVMSMPALHAYRRAYGDSRITMLVKPQLIGLWRMHEAVDDVIALGNGAGGILRAAGRIRTLSAAAAFVFPNSPRAALPPFVGGVPVRRGMRGKLRAWLLTDIVTPGLARRHVHQSWEYADILGLNAELCDEATDKWRPEIRIPGDVAGRAADMLGESGGDRFAAFVPGAARGPSKRWPAEHFLEVGRRLLGSGGVRVVVLGTGGEAGLCAGIVEGIGSGACSLAGRTTIPEMAAVLARCSVVLTNDSGGMHLATAVGRRVVAIFGLTDPAKTGPMGPGHTVIAREGVRGSRDVARDSREARECLEGISPDEVLEAVGEILGSEQ